MNLRKFLLIFGRYFVTLFTIALAGSIIQGLLSGIVEKYIPISGVNGVTDYIAYAFGITFETLQTMDTLTLTKAGIITIVYFGIIIGMSAFLAWNDNKTGSLNT